MARRLSGNAQLLLRQLGRTSKSFDELATRTKIPKKRLSWMLQDLRKLGWISSYEEVRKLPVYRRVRLPAPATRGMRGKGRAPAANFAAINAWLGIGVPGKRARGRRVAGPAE